MQVCGSMNPGAVAGFPITLKDKYWAGQETEGNKQ